jgi:hypothetical protein
MIPSMRPLAALLLLIVNLSLVLTGGCSGDGKLLIILDRPSEQKLDPLLDDRLARFSLRVNQGGSVNVSESFRTDDLELTVGDVPLGSPFNLRLAGKTSSGQMLGLGQVFDVNLDSSGSTVQVKFRKPMGYVAGQPGLFLVDATASSPSGAAPVPPMKGGDLSGVSAVASTPDGSWVLAVAGTKLVALRTKVSKMPESKWAEATIPPGGTFVAVSPDNRYAVICHTATKTISQVDLNKLAEGKSVVDIKTLSGKPTKAVFAANESSKVRVLLDGVGHLDGCNTKSSLQEVLLGTRMQPAAPLSLGKPVADVAVDPRDGALLLALPCEDALGRAKGNAAPEKIGGAVPRHYDLALSDQHLVVVGSKFGSPPKGRVVLFDLSRSGFNAQTTKDFSLPPLGVAITSSASTGAITVMSELTTFTIYDVAVTPGGQRVVALYQARYKSNIGVGSCNYNFDIRALGYLVVDLNVNSYLFSQLTDVFFDQCSTCNEPTQSGCEQWFTQGLQSSGGLTNPKFEAKGVTLLFGGS